MSPIRYRPLLSVSALAVALASQPAIAQDAPPAETASERPDDDLHNRRNDESKEIVVTAAGLTQLDVLAGTSVLEGFELQRSLEGNIGETLVKLPGVSASGFAPGSSRPVLRGFQGERVRVLIDGLGAIDVSNTSVDHAVTIDPLTAERIDVLRGPAVLLYGSSAIGGAINVIDKRIPRRMPDEAIHIDGIIRGDTAMDTREGGLSIDLPAGPNFAFHVDGSYRKTNDLEIAGFAIGPELRADLLGDAAEEEAEGELEEAEELREAANQTGILPNSATETWTANAGVTFFSGDSNLGLAVGWYDTNYGVPGNPEGGHHHGDDEEGEEEEGGEEGEEIVTIDLRQFRADLRGELDLGDGFFDTLVTRAGFSDYTHTEFEGDEVGTVFEVQGFEARAELVQNRKNGWGGGSGIQYYFRDFDAFGAEAYVPKNRTEQIALFTLQEFDFSGLHLEFAARYENTDIDSTVVDFERSFDTFSGAVSLAKETESGFRFGINANRAERAPSAEELLSNGPHIATQAFEIGDPNLSTESAWGVELFARGKIGGATVSVAAFHNWFDDYIYLQETGLEEDELPVFVYLQDDATYWGFEGEIQIPIIDSGPFRLLTDLRAEYIKAELDDNTPLPRIPPLSLLGALEADFEQFNVRGEVQWFDDQTSVSPFESQTDSFTLVNASVAWRPISGDKSVTVLLKAENIFDVTGRRHASFTKDFVPLAGRNIQASVRFSF
ncbi:TonB-dependent receptor [Parerythrobacter jejuensis]|uniref:TonB-dependent receptor n=1 Tax=Parerythrobacter jejuensis TaxID=795812 RepID=A0A845AZT3_9SPHN|nr:TonB-dependent receptor [Parerythrobacter jejuensis]MXP31246.1 TonB-dependent receptor [Parerythrobacter jejuensis]MXP34006.1 TonB-dependent receptor [Parerythrobacter jejuensis]